MRKLARGVLVAVVILILGLVLTEILVRVVGLAPEVWPAPRMIENSDKSFGLECYPSDPHESFPLDIRDESIRSRLAAEGGLDAALLAEVSASLPHCVVFRYNQQTCRSGPFKPAPDGVVSILVIGDSFTEGAGVVEQHTFVRRLEEALNAAGESRRVVIHNAGRRGRDQPGIQEALNRFLPLTRPDAVVYAFMLNDFEQSGSHATRQTYLNDLVLDRQHMGEPTWKLPTWLGHSRLVTLLAAWWRRSSVTAETIAWYRSMTGPDNLEGWSRTRRDLGEMKRSTDEAGARLLVAILPLMFGLDDDYPFAEVHADLKQACTDLGIGCIDLLPFFNGRDPGSLTVHPVDMHPNDEAHLVIAQALLPEVRRLLGAEESE